MATETPSPAAADTSFLQNALVAIKGKGLKYSMVSVFNVIFGQTLLTIFLHIGVNKAEANAAAVIISAIPAYYMSRAWVWGKRGKSELKREVLPFWIFVFIGLLLSTVGVGLVAHFYAAPKDASFFAPAKLAANVASLLAFGVLWVIRFFWMDKAFHLDHHHAHGPVDVLLDEDEPVEADRAAVDPTD